MVGIVSNPGPGMGSLPRRYFSYIGSEVPRDDPARVYEVLTRASHREQLPANASAMRWNSQGQLVLTIEVIAAPAGLDTLVGDDGLVDREQCKRPVLAFPFVLGGNSRW